MSTARSVVGRGGAGGGGSSRLVGASSATALLAPSSGLRSPEVAQALSPAMMHRVWRTAVAPEVLVVPRHALSVFRGHIGWVMGVAVSDDGRRVASCAADNTCKVGGMAHVLLPSPFSPLFSPFLPPYSESLAPSLPAHQRPSVCSYLPFSCVLASDLPPSPSPLSNVQVWGADSGSLIATFEPEAGPVDCPRQRSPWAVSITGRYLPWTHPTSV